jgi:hypothetical protein
MTFRQLATASYFLGCNRYCLRDAIFCLIVIRREPRRADENNEISGKQLSSPRLVLISRLDERRVSTIAVRDVLASRRIKFFISRPSESSVARGSVRYNFLAATRSPTRRFASSSNRERIERYFPVAPERKSNGFPKNRNSRFR